MVVLECRTSHLAARRIWGKVFRKNIHFGRVVVWCGVDQMISPFSETSMLPSIRSSINPLFQIILMLNLLCGMELIEFHPPNSSDDLCLFFCLILFLCLDGYNSWKIYKIWRRWNCLLSPDCCKRLCWNVREKFYGLRLGIRPHSALFEVPLWILLRLQLQKISNCISQLPWKLHPGL